MHIIRFLPASVLLVCACLGGQSITTPNPPTGPGKHVLFIGNSLTYVNALPSIVEALADSAREPLLETVTLAFPNYSLEDHWADGRAQTTINKGAWHLVVLQQGPSSVEQNRQLLIEFASRFDGLSKAIGATSALYMVWPTQDRPQDFDRSGESYRMAADAIGGLLFPVGEAWREVNRLDPSIALYAPDGLHPSGTASYLAALVMYAVLYDKSPIGLPNSVRLRDGSVLSVAAGTAATLQRAAASVSLPAGRVK